MVNVIPRTPAEQSATIQFEFHFFLNFPELRNTLYLVLNSLF